MNLGKTTLQDLKEKKLSIQDLNRRYFVVSKYASVEIGNVLRLLNENICDFKQIVDKFKSLQDEKNAPCLRILLENAYWVWSTKLDQNDLRYLLSKIEDWSELREMLQNTTLLKRILNEFILNKNDVDKFNKIFQNYAGTWYKQRNLHTIFDYIQLCNEDTNEVLKLNELNKKVYLLNNFDLSVDQKLELIEVLKDNEIAQNRLDQIIENHLESEYDFKSLMSYLKKVEKKNLINI